MAGVRSGAENRDIFRNIAEISGKSAKSVTDRAISLTIYEVDFLTEIDRPRSPIPTRPPCDLSLHVVRTSLHPSKAMAGLGQPQVAQEVRRESEFVMSRREMCNLGQPSRQRWRWPTIDDNHQITPYFHPISASRRRSQRQRAKGRPGTSNASWVRRGSLDWG